MPQPAGSWLGKLPLAAGWTIRRKTNEPVMSTKHDAESTFAMIAIENPARGLSPSGDRGMAAPLPVDKPEHSFPTGVAPGTLGTSLGPWALPEHAASETRGRIPEGSPDIRS